MVNIVIFKLQIKLTNKNNKPTGMLILKRPEIITFVLFWLLEKMSQMNIFHKSYANSTIQISILHISHT